jgi:CRP-like cAMP-binding protein
MALLIWSDHLEFLFNLSSLIILISWSFSNIFAIRLTAIIGYLLLLQYRFNVSITNDQFSVFIWPLLFILANLVRVALLLKDVMPKDLPEDLVQIKQELFTNMTNSDFMRFMRMSKKGAASNQQILAKGELVKNLMLVTAGSMYIQFPNNVVELGKNHFIGEMSYFNQGRASNTVFVNEPAEYYYWDYDTIHELQRKKPNLFMRLVEAMGKDIVLKMIAQNNVQMI